MSAFLSCTKENGNKEDAITVIISSLDEVLYNGKETTFNATTSGNVDEVEFYFNGNSIGSSINSPYSIKFTPTNVLPGSYTISCLARDNKGSYKGEASIKVVVRLGDELQGGRVFYLESNGEHGLISSTKDLTYSGDFGEEVGFSWGSNSLLGTSKTNGEANTALMAVNSPSSGYAAFLFKDGGGYEYNGFKDWYIPSIEELEILRKNMNYVGGFVKSSVSWQNYYWSSSESSETSAFCLNFFALSGNNSQKMLIHKVRHIRKF